MKFTVDLMFGWAHPGTKMVRNSPGYPRTWFVTALARKMMAPDGYVRMYAVRLLGLTVGVTFTRECATPITQPPSQQSLQQSLQQSSQQQLQVTPEQMAQIQAVLSKQSAPTQTTPPPPAPSHG